MQDYPDTKTRQRYHKEKKKKKKSLAYISDKHMQLWTMYRFTDDQGHKKEAIFNSKENKTLS